MNLDVNNEEQCPNQSQAKPLPDPDEPALLMRGPSFVGFQACQAPFKLTEMPVREEQ